MDSLCDKRFGQCEVYAHMHCSVDGVLLLGVGGGGDDGRGIDGYEDADGNGARVCTGCKDDFFLLCRSCYDENPMCSECRAEACPPGCQECRVA